MSMNLWVEIRRVLHGLETILVGDLDVYMTLLASIETHHTAARDALPQRSS